MKALSIATSKTDEDTTDVMTCVCMYKTYASDSKGQYLPCFHCKPLSQVD